MEIIKNDLSLRFCIWDFEEITETEITKTLNLKPLKVYVRGNQVNENISKIWDMVNTSTLSNHDKYKYFTVYFLIPAYSFNPKAAF